MSTVYNINKGVNRPIEFKGIQAQYITYLGLGLVVLLLIYAILHVLGANLYVCLAIILPAGGALIAGVQRMSKKYGEHGLMKRSAARSLPSSIQSRSRKVFLQLQTPADAAR